MKKRIIDITIKFDMSEIPENMVTPREKVTEMMQKYIEDRCEQDEGYLFTKVIVEDIY